MTVTVVTNPMPRCTRCQGQMYTGYEGEQTCMWCGEVWYPPTPLPAHNRLSPPLGAPPGRGGDALFAPSPRVAHNGAPPGRDSAISGPGPGAVAVAGWAVSAAQCGRGSHADRDDIAPVRQR